MSSSPDEVSRSRLAWMRNGTPPRLAPRAGLADTRPDTGGTMRKLQVQGVHHITLTGADRQTSIDFWEGVLGMPFVFDQPNLDAPDEGHLYFDPGDGRLITIFTNETRKAERSRAPANPCAVHHIAFTVGRVTFSQVPERLAERGIGHSGPKDS